MKERVLSNIKSIQLLNILSLILTVLWCLEEFWFLQWKCIPSDLEMILTHLLEGYMLYQHFDIVQSNYFSDPLRLFKRWSTSVRSLDQVSFVFCFLGFCGFFWYLFRTISLRPFRICVLIYTLGPVRWWWKLLIDKWSGRNRLSIWGSYSY